MLLVWGWEHVVNCQYGLGFAPHWLFEVPCGFFCGMWLTAKFPEEPGWTKRTVLKSYVIGNIGFLFVVIWWQLDFLVNLVASLLITSPLLVGYVTQTRLMRVRE